MKTLIGWPITALILLLAVWPAAGATEHLLVPGDVLKITTRGEPDLSGTFTVGDDGVLVLPLNAGKIKIQGMTLAAFGDAVTQAMAQFVKEPQVTVELSKIKLPNVKVLGEVKKEGAYDLPDGSNVFHAIVAAGGFTALADRARISILHDDNTREKVDLTLEDRATPAALPKVSDGDVINVPQLGHYTVVGEVVKPAVNEQLPSDRLTLLQAVTRAGGFTPRGNQKRVRLMRADRTSLTADLSDPTAGDGGLDVLNGDTIIVDEVPINENNVFVLGGVTTQGARPYKPGMTLLGAIAGAGGPTLGAKLNQVVVVRPLPDGKGITIKADLNKIYADPGKDVPLVAGDYVWVPGAVPRAPVDRTDYLTRLLAPLILLF